MLLTKNAEVLSIFLCLFVASLTPLRPRGRVQLAERNPHLFFSTVSPQRQTHLRPGRCCSHSVTQRIWIADRVTVEGSDDVARSHAGALRWTTGNNRVHECTARIL